MASTLFYKANVLTTGIKMKNTRMVFRLVKMCWQFSILRSQPNGIHVCITSVITYLTCEYTFSVIIPLIAVGIIKRIIVIICMKFE